MILRIVFRNTIRSFKRFVILSIIIIISLSTLYISNTIISQIENNQNRNYASGFTGDIGITGFASEPFLISGSAIPSVSTLNALPTIPEMETIEALVNSNPKVIKTIHQVSSAALLGIEGFSSPTLVFGVKYDEYFSAFNTNKATLFEEPKPNEQWIILPDSLYDSAEKSLKRKLNKDDKIQLTSANGNSFAIRVLPLRGKFTRSFKDEILSQAVLVDPATARTLAGYLNGTTQEAKTDTAEANNSQDSIIENDDFSLESLEKQMQNTSGRTEALVPIDGAWNFLLIRVEKGFETQVLQELEAQFKQNAIAVDVRDWRGIAGGKAQIVMVLQIIVNLGIGLILLITIIILTNSLKLSVYDRTVEIGTMRAIGAQKTYIIKMIGLEVLFLLAISGLIAIVLSSIGMGIMSGRISLENPIIQSFYGSTLFSVDLDFKQAILHFFFSIFIGLIALWSPLRTTLKMKPIEAIHQT